ncbi:hypothetical protein AVEN_263045-1 [Araneus ventricosus]|uniref:Uncharacterized protein n=1 Tax=Araneus ventricosus TaxID=182803 RepID=A0A4Y2GNJ6_ARAVE|nr:hypothetical protein AVEN_263045-1 [Araneus ventricosus]
MNVNFEPDLNVLCRGQTSSRWCGAKIPTLARPTHEGCKAGRGPAEKGASPACGGRDLLGTIIGYRHCPSRGSTFKYKRAESINMVRPISVGRGYLDLHVLNHQE